MRRHLVLLLVAASIAFLVGLGRGAISDSDEAFYAEAAREMVESGNWLTPFYNYEPRFQKPILYYWLAGTAFLVTGPTEFSARLPSAFSGVLLVALTWACARRWTRPGVAWMAGLITASNFGYFAMGRLALPDLPLAALMTLTTWAGVEAALIPDGGSSRGSRRARRGWVVLAAAAGALALLTKGPVGVALPVLTILIVTRLGLVGPRRWLPVGWSDLLIATVVFLAVGAPWYLRMIQEHGTAYAYRFFVGENLERFATDRYNEPRSAFFYVPIVLGGLAPWSPFVVLWLPPLIEAIRTRRATWTPVDLRLAAWALVPFVFYSLSIGKQPRYVLPMLPAMAILLAGSIDARLAALRSSVRGDRLLSGLASVAALILVILGVLLLRAAPILAALSASTTVVAAMLIILAGVCVACVAWLRPAALPLSLTAASIAALLGLYYAAYSADGMEPVQRMATAYLATRHDAEPSATHRAFVRNLIFYTGVRQEDLPQLGDVAEFLSRPERVLVVIRDHDLERLRQGGPAQPVVLASLRYFNPASLRVKTLLWPRPERDLETVHLITNRP